jgi:hypothetical protein
MDCFLYENSEWIKTLILEPLMQLIVGSILLFLGFWIYKQQKKYDKSTAKVNEQIEKAQEAIPTISRISDFVFAIFRAENDKDFLDKIFRLSEMRKEIYLKSFLNVVNLPEEMKFQNENMNRISKVKNDILKNILFEILSDKFGLIFRFDDYFKMLMTRSENTQDLLDDWLSLRNVEKQYNQKTEELRETLAEAHDENEEKTAFEKRMKEYCQRNNLKFS